MWKKMIMMLAVVAVVFGGLFGYHAFGNYMMKKYFATKKEDPVAVATDKVVVMSWQERIKAIGDVRAAQGIDVASEVPGIVSAVSFASGEDVTEGKQLLLLNADADLAYLDALKAAAELAQTVHDRDLKQFEVRAVSQAVIDADAAELKSRKAQVLQQEAMIAKKLIRAPFTGRLGISSVSVGQYINPGERIVSLQALDPVKVDFFLPQQDMAKVGVGQDVFLETDAFPGRPFKGKISAVNVLVETSSRNIQVEVTVPNPDKVLVPGMFVSLMMDAGSAVDTLVVPQTAVAFNPYGETVFLVEDDGKDDAGKSILKARQAFITTGVARGDLVSVVSGLKEGDVIVSAGSHKLRNGSLITVNNTVQPLKDEAPSPADM